MADRHPPVQNWATDFDHTDPAWTADPYPIWDDLRQRCPVAHTGRYGEGLAAGHPRPLPSRSGYTSDLGDEAREPFAAPAPPVPAHRTAP